MAKPTKPVLGLHRKKVTLEPGEVPPQEYDNSQSLVLFPNKYKTDPNDKIPDYKGTITLEDGTERVLCAWKKFTKRGVPYLTGRWTERISKEEYETEYRHRKRLYDTRILPTNKKLEMDEPF